MSDLVKEQREVYSKAQALNDKSKAENRDLTAEELVEFNNHISKGKELENRIAREQQMFAIHDKMKESNGRISPVYQGEIEPEKSVHADVSKFSLTKAINDYATYGHCKGLEGEVSHELMKKHPGMARNSFLMPMQQFSNVQTYANTDTSTAAGILNTPVMYQNFIDLFRNKMYTQQLGATVLTNLSGSSVSLPRQSAGATCYWTDGGASSNLTAGNQTADSVTMVPKMLGCNVTFPRNLMTQSSMSVEQFVRNDSVAQIARELDRAGVAGSGSSNQPVGILNNGSVPVVTTVANSGNGDVLVWADLVSHETKVAINNADFGNDLAYLMTPQLRGKLKASPKVATYSANMIWADDNTINGYPAYATNQMPANLTKGSSSGICSSSIFGKWSELIYGFWDGAGSGDGAISVLVNPYTNAASGAIQVVFYLDCQVALRHATSFSIINNALTT